MRREKSLSYIQEESQAPRRNGSNSGLEHLGSAKKRNSTETEEETKAGHSESDTGLSSKAYGIASYVVTNSEDEDVCPTCLEGKFSPSFVKLLIGSDILFQCFDSCLYGVPCTLFIFARNPYDISCRIYSRKSEDRGKMLPPFSSKLYIRMDGKERQLSDLWKGILGLLFFS